MKRRPELSRFHEKLINAMVYDIFISVLNRCDGNMKDTQRSLSFLFFGEDHLDEMDHVNHPELLKEVMIKRMTSPIKFIKVFEHVHTLK